MTPKEVVEAFWAAMNTNDFHAAATHLTEGYSCHWPQSGETIHGPANFAAFNTAYPTKGRWSFTIHRLIAEGPEVVTDVAVTDGAGTNARVISFATIEGAKIATHTEYWPDPFPTQDWRKAWVTLQK
ncbi:MAG: nuclear transport factor 2 family protein [Pseudomonadota bacterium]